MLAGASQAGLHQTGEISGQLIDLTTGRPVVGAVVCLVETGRQARTDSLGWFQFADIAIGVYHLTIAHPSYGIVRDIAELTVVVRDGRAADVKLSLSALVGAVEAEEVKRDTDDANYRSETQRQERSEIVRSPSINDVGMQSLVRVPAEQSSPNAGGEAGHRGKTVVTCPPYPGIPMPTPPAGYESWPQDMFFRDYGTNGFVDTRRDRLSTFATDVDDASFEVARRYLAEGNFPPADAIRVEEFVNHFEYGYLPPQDSKFRIFTEVGASPFESDRYLMKIAVKGREIEPAQRRPMNLTFVVDVSGSMRQGNRIQLVKESLKMIARSMRPEDRIGIVSYESAARLVLEPVNVRAMYEIERAIDRLTPGGSTNAEAGLGLGYDMANRQFVPGHSNVVMLFSDGVANVGATGPGTIWSRIEQFANKGLSLVTFGYGMGNYNDVLLEQLAQKGNGHYAYINTFDDAREQFVNNLVGNVQLLARDMKVQVEFNPKAVSSYRLLGYENRDVADERFRDNAQDGGEVGAGHEITAMYEIVLNSRGAKGKLATVYCRWKNDDGYEVTEVARDVSLDRGHKTFDSMRAEFRLAVVASRFAEKLKGTPYAATTTWEELSRLADKIGRELPGKQTNELREMIVQAGHFPLYHTERRYGDDEDFVNYKR